MSLRSSYKSFPTFLADDNRFSLLITSRTAKPMAQDTGLPPKVEKYAPNFLDTLEEVMTAPMGCPAPRGRPTVTISGTIP